MILWFALLKPGGGPGPGGGHEPDPRSARGDHAFFEKPDVISKLEAKWVSKRVHLDINTAAEVRHIAHGEPRERSEKLSRRNVAKTLRVVASLLGHL